MLRVFFGMDAREAVGAHVFVQSVVEQMGPRVALTALSGAQRDGTNSFSYERFLVPYYCGFEGRAVWCDGADMLLRDDMTDLPLWLGGDAVAVVKHEYRPRHARKYVGTPMEADNLEYPRKNWSSLIVWNCGHYMNRRLTPEYVADMPGEHLHRFGWLEDDQIGSLPHDWNWLCDEYGASTTAKLLHWTNGIPGFTHYAHAPHAGEWKDMLRRVQRGL